MNAENVKPRRTVTAQRSELTIWKAKRKRETSKPSIRHTGCLLRVRDVIAFMHIAAELPDDGLIYLIYLYLYIYNQELSGRNPSISAVDAFDEFPAGDHRLSNVTNRNRPRGRRRRCRPWQDCSAACVAPDPGGRHACRMYCGGLDAVRSP